MSTSPADFNAKVIDEFRANGGHVGGIFAGMPILLVHHTGAKSGAERINPVAYLRDGSAIGVQRIICSRVPELAHVNSESTGELTGPGPVQARVSWLRSAWRIGTLRILQHAADFP